MKPIGRGRTATIYAWEDNRVLKLFNQGYDRSMAEREAWVSKRVQEAGLPVPAVYDLVELNGQYGVVYERIDGKSMLNQLQAKPWRGMTLARQLADLHAAVHRTHLDDFPSHRERMVWQIEHADPMPDPIKIAALDALGKLPDGHAVCHGDFHPDNILMSPRGPVIIDWESVTRGNPLADVARSLLLISLGEPVYAMSTAVRWMMNRTRVLFCRAYLQRYLKLSGATKEAIQAWALPVAAARLNDWIPEEQARLLAYIETLLPPE
jgi:uncharacterized protein (TIGR02172 family)